MQDKCSTNKFSNLGVLGFSAKLGENYNKGKFRSNITLENNLKRTHTIVTKSKIVTDNSPGLLKNGLQRLSKIKGPSGKDKSHDEKIIDEGTQSNGNEMNNVATKSNQSKPIWYLTRTTIFILLIQIIFLFMFTGLAR